MEFSVKLVQNNNDVDLEVFKASDVKIIKGVVEKNNVENEYHSFEETQKLTKKVCKILTDKEQGSGSFIRIPYKNHLLKINTDLKSLKPCIDIRFPLRMFGNLAPLKQWNLHRRFKHRYYCPRSLNVCVPEIK